jgi:hypothetical protein
MGRASARQIAYQRRRRNIAIASGSTGAVIVAVVLIVVLGLQGSGQANSKSKEPVAGDYGLPPRAENEVLGVSVSKLVAAAKAEPEATTPPYKLPAGNAALTSGGKPEILYIGAEFCPYCAGERWPLVMALSKFGTFKGLMGTSSSATDPTFPMTPTFTFYGSTYTSKYLSFVPVELETNTDVHLQTPTAQQKALLGTWDAPPYIPKGDAGEEPIPFIYMGGRYLLTGIQYLYSGSNGMSGWNFSEAASDLTSGKGSMSKGALAAAGYLVGDICTLTHNQPTEVCSQVPAMLKGINTSSPRGNGSSATGKGTATTAKPANSTGKGTTTTAKPAKSKASG